MADRNEILNEIKEDARCATLLINQMNRLDSFGEGDLRYAVSQAAKDVALRLDAYWRQAQDCVQGPVDVIDLFCGCGGMTAGFVAANGLSGIYRPILAIDIDEPAIKTYHRNIGLKPMNVDISELADDESHLSALVAQAGRRDGHPLVLIGCAPCQGFSSLRNGSATLDERNTLYDDFMRIAAILAPEIIVAENVPGILTMKFWNHVGDARDLLERKGYFVNIDIHNLAEFGAPQERFRVVLLAMKKPFAVPRGFLSRTEFRTVRDAIGYLPAVDPGEICQSDPMHYTARHRESTVATIKAVPKDGGSRPDDVGPVRLQRIRERQGKAAYEDVYGRLYWDRPAITITGHARSPASGRFVHPQQDRGLSVREAALLQGFPSDYLFEGTLDQRFMQIGNAVPPTFAAYLAVHLFGELMDSSTSTDSFDKGITETVGASFSRMIPSIKSGHR